MRRFLVSFVVLALLFSHPFESKAKESLIDAKSSQGVVMVKKPKMGKGEFAVVQLSKGDKSYAFPLNKQEAIPTPFGTGTHQVVVAINKNGKFRLIESKSVTLKFSELARTKEQTILSPGVTAPHVKYMLDTKFIGWKKWSDSKKVQSVHSYITRHFSYDYARENNQGAWYVPDYSRFMKNKKGTCYDMASLSSSLLREMNVPTRLVMGFPKNYGYHAWNEVYVDGSWKLIDTTFDLNRKVSNPYKKAKDYQVKYRF